MDLRHPVRKDRMSPFGRASDTHSFCKSLGYCVHTSIRARLSSPANDTYLCHTPNKKILGCVYAKTAQTPIFSVKRRSKPRASGGDARWMWLVCRKRPETWINIYICIYICTYINTAHAHTHTHTHTQTHTHTRTAERGLKYKPSYGSVPYPLARLSWSELSH